MATLEVASRRDYAKETTYTELRSNFDLIDVMRSTDNKGYSMKVTSTLSWRFKWKPKYIRWRIPLLPRRRMFQRWWFINFIFFHSMDDVYLLVRSEWKTEHEKDKQHADNSSFHKLPINENDIFCESLASSIFSIFNVFLLTYHYFECIIVLNK